MLNPLFKQWFQLVPEVSLNSPGTHYTFRKVHHGFKQRNYFRNYKKFGKKENDTGCPQVQIALLNKET